jgi:hypothetical protein
MSVDSKKPFRFHETDPKTRCMICNRPLKLNLLARKTTKLTLCYKHWMQNIAIKKDIKTLEV